MSELFAVRWARRELKRMFTLDYTKWHASKGNGCFTLCGVSVGLALNGTFFPETDESLKKVNCRKCLRLLIKS